MSGTDDLSAQIAAAGASVAADEPDAVRPADADRTRRTHGCDVLIADDTGASREILSAVLRNFAGGLRIGEARNGVEALSRWFELYPRVTFLDVDMPGLDGFAVLRQIREADPSAFVAMVTGKSSADNVRQALAMGASGFVVKPYMPRRVLDLLRRYQDLTGVVLLRRDSLV